MCGLAGLIDFGGLGTDEIRVRAHSALEVLRARGPDGEGIWSDACCTLVHTRLAIIDLSALGAQPMERDDHIVVFNGEIFNFSELRDELYALGHRFRSNSDTEVLLVGWRQWRDQLLPRLVGMFAFAIWDRAERTLFAARDRFGEKPFLYGTSHRRLAFGSNLLACEAMLGETRPIDPAALRALFTVRFVPEPWCIAQGVRKLPAGHWLKFSPHGLHIEPWYNLRCRSVTAPRDYGEAQLDVRQAFDAAVRARLVSDVPVGVFLSSGIDSALVAASVAAAGTVPKTFTVGFEGASAYYEERPMAAAVARHLGTDHTEISIDVDSIGSKLDRIFAAFDEPFGDASAVPTFLISEATRRQVAVVLTGDGADEVFAGYRRYWSEAHAERWNRLPKPIRGFIAAALASLPESKDYSVLEWIRRARRFVATADPDPARRQAAWMRLATEAEIDQLLGPSGTQAISVEQIVHDARAAAECDDPINAMLACDVACELPGDMLFKVDRASMAHALETRAPFLDQRVVEAAFALPGHLKLKTVGGRVVGKSILRTAFRDRLPAEVFARAKRGFEMPVAALLKGEASDRLAAAVDESRLRRQGLFEPAVVGGWRDGLSKGRDTSWQLWTMLAFQEWARLHRRPEALA